MSKKILLGLLAVALTGVTKAQGFGDIYEKTISGANTIDYPSIREADVIWSKRYYRAIDLREKINQPLYYPTVPTSDGRKSFITILLEEIKEGRVTALDPLSVDVNTTYADIETRMGSVERTESITINAQGATQDVDIKTDAKLSEVKQLTLYEEWYFDKRLGKLDVRIIAIQPIFMGYDEQLGRIVRRPLFWVKYDDIRGALAKHEVFVTNNDAQRISFDDIFMQRKFGSIILGESNVYNDRYISDYEIGRNILLEAERLKMELFNFEHDLWEY